LAISHEIGRAAPNTFRDSSDIPSERGCAAP
jgi:hypothetical protein